MRPTSHTTLGELFIPDEWRGAQGGVYVVEAGLIRRVGGDEASMIRSNLFRQKLGLFRSWHSHKRSTLNPVERRVLVIRASRDLFRASFWLQYDRFDLGV